MATDIILRSIKASALTHAEMDQNWESLAQTVDAVVANKTVAVTDQNKILECAITSGTITLPTVANAAGTDTDSFKITIKNIDVSSLTVDGNGAETIEGAANVTLLENESAEFTLSSGSAEWNITGFYNPNLVGITSTATELNVLDGITPTTTELNYVNGVTSAIQTQINGKQPLDADLTAIAALANTDSNFIVGNGSAWVAESGATARTSLGVDASGTDNSTPVTLAGTGTHRSLSGQALTINKISLTADVTGSLPTGNIAASAVTTAKIAASAVTTAKIADLNVTGAKIANTTLSEGKFPALAGGTSYRHHFDDGGSTTSVTLIGVGIPFVILRAGTYRVSFTVTNSDGVDNTGSQIFKNASTAYSGFAAIGTLRTVTNTTPTTYTEDLAFNAGDMIQIYTRSDGSGTNPTISNIFTSTTTKLFG
jgi:hypothetical protein